MSPTKKAEKPAIKAKPLKGRGPGRPALSNEKLLDKALDLFLNHGFERTSVDAIAATAGVAKRTIYLRYGDKESLFKVALERAIEEWIVPNELLQAAECDDLEKTLLDIGDILVSNIMKPAGLRLMRITNAESGRMPEIGAYTFQHGTGPTIAFLADLFRRRIKFNTTENFDVYNEAAIAFLYLVVCGPPTVTAWGMTLDDETIKRHTCFCVHLFLHGALPRDDMQPQKTAALQEVTSVELDSRFLHPGSVNTSDENDLIKLQNENRRLRKLLVASMLEVESLKEQSGSH